MTERNQAAGNPELGSPTPVPTLQESGSGTGVMSMELAELLGELLIDRKHHKCGPTCDCRELKEIVANRLAVG